LHALAAWLLSFSHFSAEAAEVQHCSNIIVGVAVIMIRRFHAHVPGLVYVSLLALLAVAAMNNQNNLLFWLFGVMVSGLVISAIITNLMIWRLKVRRLDPQSGSVGEPLIVRYAVTNRAALVPAFNIHLSEVSNSSAGSDWTQLMKDARAWIMHVGPGETVHGETIFWPTRRGQVAFNRLRIWTTFPFGIFRKSITITQPLTTLIYPMVYELRPGILDAVLPAGLIGARVTQHSGAGDDYFGVREFKPGDSMRHIAWKQTARTDELITIERASPSPAKLRVILDLTVPTAQLRVDGTDGMSGRDLEERAISLAASMIRAADLDGFEVGLTVVGLDVPMIAVRRNQWHLKKIMAALASLDLDQSRIAARPQPIREVERAALVVIAPDRVQPLAARDDAMHLSARQLDSLVARPIGWNADAASKAPRKPLFAKAGAAA
jgi:uncharacterized protein (DUF58 family)